MGIKISQLPVASNSQDTDIIPIVQAGRTKQIQKSIFNQNINEEIETIQQDILDIQKEQTTQNENIQDNADNIIALTEKHNKEIEALENILPKSTATGEYITLDNSANYKFNYFNNGGNTEQESYSGKNLADKLIMNGSTKNATFDSYTGKLTIAIKTSAGTSQVNYKLFYSGGTSGGDGAITGANTDNNVWRNKTIDVENVIGIALYNVTSTNARTLEKIVVAQGEYTITDDTYEPYVGGTPSPNPDYPQKVNNVGSNVNLLNVTQNKKNITSQYTSVIYGDINLIEGKTYTLSLDTNNNGGKVYINENYFNHPTDAILNCDGTRKQYTCTAKVTGNYNDISIIKTSSNVSTAYNLDNIKLEEGLTATGYTPYNRGGIDVKVENKNLFNTTNIPTKTNYGLTSSINTNKELVINGTITGSGHMYPTSPNSSPVKIGKLKAGTYTTKGILSSGTITKNISDIAIIVFRFVNNSQDNLFQLTGTHILNGTVKNFTITEDTDIYFGIFVNNASGGSFVADNAIIQVQIEKGSTASSYIAHAEQNITIPLPTGMELCKIGNYSDKIFHNIPSNPMYNASLVEGGWYKYQIIQRLVFNGDAAENWTIQNSKYFICTSNSQLTRFFDYWFSPIPNPLNTNMKTSIGFVTYQTLDNQTGYGLAFAYGVRINLKDIDVTNGGTTAQLRTYLNNNPITVIIRQKDPTYTQITDTDTIEALNTLENTKTYQGQTNISSDNIPSPIFDIEYFLASNSYSYDEHEVGTWLNGETLYRKTYKYTDLSANVEYIDIGTLPSNITVVGISGVNLVPSIGVTRQLPYKNDNVSLYVIAITNESKLRLYKTGTFIVADESVIVTIEYIKN